MECGVSTGPSSVSRTDSKPGMRWWRGLMRGYFSIAGQTEPAKREPPTQSVSKVTRCR